VHHWYSAPGIYIFVSRSSDNASLVDHGFCLRSRFSDSASLVDQGFCLRSSCGSIKDSVTHAKSIKTRVNKTTWILSSCEVGGRPRILSSSEFGVGSRITYVRGLAIALRELTKGSIIV
jgi:hypothetical protein